MSKIESPISDSSPSLKVAMEEIAKLCAELKRERDEARELAQQMSESNQVLLADVKYYRGEFERMRRSHE